MSDNSPADNVPQAASELAAHAGQSAEIAADRADQSRPWWREPWPWILMAGPALAVVGCMITIALAVQNFSDQGISDGGIKRGLVVAREAPDLAAGARQP
ncbi:hypothetical protein ERE07_15575 [Allopusillimonas ginsengisoli]|nr:hypothetical protein ERE07_15575 [Allopusillimonas ginsengisoli]